MLCIEMETNLRPYVFNDNQINNAKLVGQYRSVGKFYNEKAEKWLKFYHNTPSLYNRSNINQSMLWYSLGQIKWDTNSQSEFVKDLIKITEEFERELKQNPNGDKFSGEIEMVQFNDVSEYDGQRMIAYNFIPAERHKVKIRKVTTIPSLIK